MLAYYDVRDKLTVQDTLVFKGPLIVIPSTLRKEMIELVHATHIGTEGCLRRARDIMYWPRMSSYTTERLHLKVRCVHDSLTTTKQGANSTT